MLLINGGTMTMGKCFWCKNNPNLKFNTEVNQNELPKRQTIYT